MKNLFEGEGGMHEFQDIAPMSAREDYFNHMIGLSFFLQAGRAMTDEEFRILAKEQGFHGVPTFSEKYTDQKNILDNQPDGVVEQLDALALEVTQHCKDETLTIEMYEHIAKQMKALCSQK